ncbi:MAG: asparagine synthase [Magnetospirillum sp.]|nr:asparagine synthase [Magnetospirillum sp.]
MTLAGGAGPADFSESLDRMTAALSLSARRPVRWLGDDAALACLDGGLLHRHPSGLAIAFTGRLDNAADLAAALGPDAPVGDRAALIGDVYRRWGLDCFDRLIGDFACAVWDEGARRLILARDALGGRPLHWARSGPNLVFASESRGLLALPQIPKELNEAWLAERLALLPCRGEDTAYKGIHSLPAGHFLVFERGAVRLVRTWKPESLPLLELRRDEDYVEALRQCLAEAVRCRLPDSGAVASHLSAGLDSSAIAATAASQLAEQGRRLQAYTAVPRPGLDWPPGKDGIPDEGRLAALTAGRWPNMDHVLIPNQSGALMTSMGRFNQAFERPVFTSMNTVWAGAIFDDARRRGVTVLLEGGGGNLTFSYDGLQLLPSLVRQGRLWELTGLCRQLHREGGLGLLRLSNLAFGPFLPAALRNFARHLTGRRPETELSDYSAIQAQFADRTGVAEATAGSGGAIAHHLRGDGRLFRLLALLRNDRGMHWAGRRRLSGIDMRDPLLDRRLVELCLAIPERQFLLGGVPRSLARRVLAGLVPTEILAERRRGCQAADWYEGFASARPEIEAEITRLESSPLAKAILDLPRLRRLVDDWPQDGWQRPEVEDAYRRVLGRGLSAGVFLRQFENSNLPPSD